MNKSKILGLFGSFFFIFPCLYAQTNDLKIFSAISDSYATKVVNAIFIVEGGTKTKYPYGIKSVKTSNPRQVCLNTVRNNWIRWQKTGAKGDFLDFLADRYCPQTVDYQGNVRWKRNIHKLIP